MKKFALQLSGLNQGRLTHWWGEAENIAEAMALAEGEPANSGRRVVYGVTVTDADYELRDTFA